MRNRLEDKDTVLRIFSLSRFSIYLTTIALAGITSLSTAQIGGKTALDGDFVLDDAEDLNLAAESVGRNWVFDFVDLGANPSLTPVVPAAESLTIAAGQSTAGAFKFRVPAEFGEANKSFGVPLPAIVGASTAVSPGNLQSFASMYFFAASTSAIAGEQYLVVLESYPQQSNMAYPKAYWGFTPPSGNNFGLVAIDLHQPDLIENASGLTIEDLLGQTRFIAVAAYAQSFLPSAEMILYIDDITFSGMEVTRAHHWTLYE